MNEGIKHRLDEIAKSYHLSSSIEDKFIEDSCQRFFCDDLKDIVRPGSKILELGFGEGITSNTLCEVAEEYVVLEGSSLICSNASSRYPKLTMVNELFEEFECSQQFDQILALHVFEHIDSPSTLLKRMKRWLKPNGEIIAVVPNKESIHRRVAYEMGLISALDELSDRDKLVGHLRVYDLSELRELFTKENFRISLERGYFLKTLANSQMLDYSEDLLLGLNKVALSIPTELCANILIKASVY